MSKKEINLTVPEWVENKEKQPKENWHNENKKEPEVNQEYMEDNRPDEVANFIINKINLADFKDYQIQPIISDIKRCDTVSAAGKLSEFIELTDKEKNHFKQLPPEIVLSWFKQYIKNGVEEDVAA